MTLFDGPDKTPAPRTPPPSDPRPKWSAIQSGRCDQCVTKAARNPLLRIAPARWRRQHGADDARLCYEHARPLRDVDDTVTERTKRKAG